MPRIRSWQEIAGLMLFAVPDEGLEAPAAGCDTVDA
jgi:hypothetical protein